MGDATQGVKLDGWTLGPPEQPATPTDKPQTYATLDEFHSAVDSAVGKGRWQPTGDYRPGWREDQLRAQGAQTVAPGHTSMHSKGGWDDPGAHDIVIPGVSPQQGAAMLRKIPGVMDVKWEGAHGTQGGHFHVDMADRTGWTVDGATPKPKGWTLGPEPKAAPKPSNRAAKINKPNMLDQYGQNYRGRIEESGQGIAEAGRLMSAENLKGRDPLGIAGQEAMGALQGVGAGFGYLASPVTAALDTTLGSTVETATKNAPHGKVAGVAYDARMPKTFVGDAALQVGGVALGGESGALKTQAERLRAWQEKPYVASPDEVRARQGEHPSPHQGPVKPQGDAQTGAETKPGATEPRGEKAAQRASQSRAKRDARKGISDPERVKAKQAASPSPHQPPERAAAPPELPVRNIAAAEPSTDILYAPEGYGDGHGPGDTPPPGGEEHHGPVVGSEPHPIERIDNAFYRMGGSATADKLEAAEFLKGVPEELSDPQVQSRLADEIEKQLVDPSHQIPDDLKPAYEAFAKWRDEVRDTVNRLRARNDPDLDPFLPETGYTPRRAKGHTPMFDAAEGPTGDRDPIVKANIIPSKRNLSKDTGSLQSRTAGWIVDDGSGNLQFTQEKPGDDVPHRVATMDEVEANTDIRYYRNPLINTVDEALRLRRVERNIQVLDEIKTHLKDEGMAFHYEWHSKNENGEWVRRGPGEHDLPEGFVPIRNVPQLKGWAFHPEIAEVMKDYYPPPGTDLEEALGRLNRIMIGSLFITPIPHILNVGAHAVSGRGWDWFDIPGMAKGDLAAIPRGYVRGFTTGLQAMHEVWTKGPLYRQMLREGSGLLYGDTQVRNFLNLMLEKAGYEITSDPETWSQFARQFDLKSMGIHTAQDFTRLVYGASNKSMWLVNDMFMMQRVLELQKKGLDVREAIKETEKDIPNYRIPSRVMGSRGIAEFMKSRSFIVFGRYKYGQWKALSGMFKELIGKDASPDERLEALGKFIVTGVTMAAIFPAMDKLLQEATGNKDARVRRPGPFAILDAIAQVAKGEKDVPTGVASMFSWSPLLDDSYSASHNRDFYGRPIWQFDSPLGAAVQTAEFASNPIYPLKVAEDFAKPGGGVRAVGRMFGLDIPPEGSKAMQAKYVQRDRKAAARREAHDPLEVWIKNLLAGKPTGPPPEAAPAAPEGDQPDPTGWKLGPVN